MLFEDWHFDYLVCVDALNCFVEAEFMREAVRGLKPGGFSWPNRRRPLQKPGSAASAWQSRED